MVLNSMLVLTVARVSAEAWQWMACMGEPPLNSDEMLDLICCFPFHQLTRLALCLCSFFCLPQPDSYYPYSYFPSDDDSDSDDSHDFDHYYYQSHSD